MNNDDESYESYESLKNMRTDSSSNILEKQLRSIYLEQQKRIKENYNKQKRFKWCKCC